MTPEQYNRYTILNANVMNLKDHLQFFTRIGNVELISLVKRQLNQAKEKLAESGCVCISRQITGNSDI